MSETALAGNAVESLHIGNTRVRICDDYCRSIGSLTAETTRGYAET